MVTVYTKPRCVQCNATYRALDKNGIAYQSVDLSQNPELLEELKEEGHLGAPVVKSATPVGDWAGFQPDKIEELNTYLTENPSGPLG
jgi:glutaredoxin-like protein NrdH